MKCQICKEDIIVKITLKNFFKRNIEEICDVCHKKYFRKVPEYIVIPIENYLIHMYVVGTKNYKDEHEELIFFNKAIHFYRKKYHMCDMILIIINSVDDSIIKIIDKLNLSDIILITMKYKGEMSYEI